jgi:hypothetical protein
MKFLIIHPIRRDFNHPTQKIAVSGIASWTAAGSHLLPALWFHKIQRIVVEFWKSGKWIKVDSTGFWTISSKRFHDFLTRLARMKDLQTILLCDSWAIPYVPFEHICSRLWVKKEFNWWHAHDAGRKPFRFPISPCLI